MYYLKYFPSLLLTYDSFHRYLHIQFINWEISILKIDKSWLCMHADSGVINICEISLVIKFLQLSCNIIKIWITQGDLRAIR